jgi:Na+-transporting methylmalonyl-CoA/oxaloacetate decarboxylase gamma subunit
MEENTQNQTEQSSKIRKEGSVGAMIGSVIVILIILAGGVYFMTSLHEKIVGEEIVEPKNDTNEIEAELDTTNIDQLDAELEQIEAEIEASLQE